jgi:hypothetical protein
MVNRIIVSFPCSLTFEFQQLQEEMRRRTRFTCQLSKNKQRAATRKRSSSGPKRERGREDERRRIGMSRRREGASRKAVVLGCWLDMQCETRRGTNTTTHRRNKQNTQSIGAQNPKARSDITESEVEREKMRSIN